MEGVRLHVKIPTEELAAMTVATKADGTIDSAVVRIAFIGEPLRGDMH